MKKILLFLIAIFFFNSYYGQLPTVAGFQQQKTTYWQTALSALKQDPNYQSPANYSVLYDKVVPFSGLYTYHEPDNNVSGANHFRQALSEMYNASDKNLFESVEILEGKINTLTGRDVVPIGILNTEFTYLNYTPENASLNCITQQNGIFYPIQGKPAFTYKHISVIAPLKKLALVTGTQVTYRFSSSVWYHHSTKNIVALTADFGTGAAVPVIQNGQLLQTDFPVTYSTFEETKLLTFNIIFSDNSTLTTYAGIGVGQKPASSTAKGISQLLDYTSTIPDVVTGATGKIEYRIFYGDNNINNVLNKPFIIVDGFDPGDKRKIIVEDCIDDTKYECVKKNKDFKADTYQSISTLMQYNNQTSDLKEQLTALNYDVIIVNFPNYVNNLGATIDGGADDIFRNGRTMASFITYINAELQAQGSTEKLVVVGPSMGGQITRYALAYLEKNNIPTNTSFWVSMDSPHQGATIPLAISGDLYFMGELLGKDEAKEQYRNTIKSPAARQMLLGIAGGQTNFYNAEHDSYIQQLKANGVPGSNGYPVLNGIKKIAIANGSLSGIKNVTPSQKFYEIAAFAKVRFLGIKVDNKPVFRLNNWFMPEKNTSNTLLKNYSYQPEQTLNWNLANNLWMGSLDAVPGGTFNSADDTKHAVYDQLNETNAFSFPLSGTWFLIPVLWTGEKLKVEQRLPNNINTPITPQAFIATHSALDTTGFNDWYQPIANLVCSGQTPFDSFYGETSNMGHISFTDDMVAWLKNNLSLGLQPPSFPVDPEQLEGPTPLCLNTINTYFFSNSCKVPGIPVWSVSDNLQILSSTDYSVTVKAIASGNASITAAFATGSVTKNIVMPRPKPLSFALENPAPPYYCITPPELLEMSIESNYVRANFTGMTLAEINNSQNWEWQPDNNLITLSGSGNKRIICPVGTGYTSFKVRARNGCSWSEWYQYPTFQIKAKPIVYFTVAPNPATETLNVNLENNNIQLPTSASSSMNVSSEIPAKLYDSLGNQKASFNIINNAATIDINHLPAGVYYLKILIGNKLESHTVIKQ